MASLSIGAELFLMELFARFCHEVLGQMCLFYNFVCSMSVRALVAPSAITLHFVVLAHLSLLLLLVLLDECTTFFLHEVLRLVLSHRTCLASRRVAG